MYTLLITDELNCTHRWDFKKIGSLEKELSRWITVESLDSTPLNKIAIIVNE